MSDGGESGSVRHLPGVSDDASRDVVPDPSTTLADNAVRV
jgi:hypothetical protein